MTRRRSRAARVPILASDGLARASANPLPPGAAIAVVADPMGATVGLLEWPDRAREGASR